MIEKMTEKMLSVELKEDEVVDDKSLVRSTIESLSTEYLEQIAKLDYDFIMTVIALDKRISDMRFIIKTAKEELEERF